MKLVNSESLILLLDYVTLNSILPEVQHIVNIQPFEFVFQ